MSALSDDTQNDALKATNTLIRGGNAKRRGLLKLEITDDKTIKFKSNLSARIWLGLHPFANKHKRELIKGVLSSDVFASITIGTVDDDMQTVKSKIPAKTEIKINFTPNQISPSPGGITTSETPEKDKTETINTRVDADVNSEPGDINLNKDLYVPEQRDINNRLLNRNEVRESRNHLTNTIKKALTSIVNNKVGSEAPGNPSTRKTKIRVDGNLK